MCALGLARKRKPLPSAQCAVGTTSAVEAGDGKPCPHPPAHGNILSCLEDGQASRGLEAPVTGGLRSLQNLLGEVDFPLCFLLLMVV